MTESDAFLLTLARCAGFFFRAPGFSHPSVPPPLRAGFAYVFALVFAHGVSGKMRLPPGGFLAAVLSETLLGAAIGIAASMLYDGAYAGGRLVDDYIGIKVNMPAAGVVAPSGFGRLWSQAFATGFFVLGGCSVTVLAFAHTFETLSPGSLLTASDLRTFAYTLPTTLARAALLVAAPAIAVAFVVQFALAAASRVVSRLSVFSLSFALVFACVLAVTLTTLPSIMRASAAPWMDLSVLHVR
jgi:flagellar biosynthesis protein FliR